MELINNLLGLDVAKLNGGQMAARAFVVFFSALALIRIAGIRTLGKQCAFDTLTLLMLGAITGRAIVTEQSFFGSLLAAAVLVVLHRLLAWGGFHSKLIGKLLKGDELLLMRDGNNHKANMAKEHITEKDMEEAVRREANINSMEEVKEIYLERSGDISIVKK